MATPAMPPASALVSALTRAKAARARQTSAPISRGIVRRFFGAVADVVVPLFGGWLLGDMVAGFRVRAGASALVARTRWGSVTRRASRATPNGSPVVRPADECA